MIQEFQIRVLPVLASSEQNIISYIADEKGIDARTVNAVRVLKRSIDARQRKVDLANGGWLADSWRIVHNLLTVCHLL